MKKLILLLFVLATLAACKNNNTSSNETATEVAEEISEEKEFPYQLSLAQWSLNRPIFAGTMDPLDFAAKAKELGFEGLEYVSQLYVNENVNYSMKGAPLQDILNELKKRSDSLDMQNLIIMIDGEGDLSFNDKAATKTAIENHKKWVDAAAFLGCHSIRINLFGESNPADWKKNSIASLKALGTYAATKNVNVIVENHGGLSSQADLLAEVMAAVAMSNVGTLPDFGNFCVKREGGVRWGAPCVEEYDKYKGIAELMPYAKGVSAKSYSFDEAGDENTLDYYRFMDIVADANYSGFVGIEFEGDVDDPVPGIIATKELVIKAATE